MGLTTCTLAAQCAPLSPRVRTCTRIRTVSRWLTDPSSRHRLALVLLWIVPAVWSSNYLISRAAAPLVPPHVLAFGRWAIVVAVLLPWCLRGLLAAPAPERTAWRARLRAEWRRCLVLGMLGMWICGAWVYLAGRTTSATNIALIYAAAPVGIAIASRRLLGEHQGGTQAVGMALALLGVVFVIVRGDPQVLLSLSLTAGDLWVLAAMLAWVTYSVLLLYWRTALSAIERLCCSALGGLVVMLPFVVVEVSALERPLSARAWVLVVAAALLPGLLSYLAYGFVQRELGAARTALMLYLAPVYGAWLAWWLLDEPPRWYHWVGAALILPSIHLASRGTARARPAATVD